jgi:hypothetical protein
MPEPMILLEEVSPAAAVMATVESDGQSIYLYLYGAKDSGFGTRALWVANLGPAPETIDLDRMKLGEPPSMPASGTRHPSGLSLGALEPLRLVWFPEGTGVALFGRDELLAVIPPGTRDEGDFSGFARESRERTKLAWPLEAAEGEATREAVKKAQAFWTAWEAEDAWPKLQDRLLRAIDAALGNDGRSFAVDGGEWPPRFVAVRRTRKAMVFVTGGVSIRPQPGVARAPERPLGPRRIELALALRGEVDDAAQKRLITFLGGRAELPWLRTTWLGHGHTLGCDVIPGGRFTAVMFAEHPAGAPKLVLPEVEGEPVTLLWLIPITTAERALAVAHGSKVLRDRLAVLDELWAHEDRADLSQSN